MAINPNTFYSAEALLKRKDIDGNTPEIYIVVGNRSAGKTTDFSRRIIEGWLNGTYRQVMILTRYITDIQGVGQAFFDPEFMEHFFPDVDMESIEYITTSRVFQQILIDKRPFGWIVAINASDKVKKYSKLFNEVDCMWFDEFLPETGRYCPKEVSKFKSIHVSVARAYGQQSRYVPVFMASNYTSMLNPYFISLGVVGRLDSDTRFLRGKSFVLEQNMNKNAQKAQQESGFLSAFSGDDTEYYTGERVYLLDNQALVEKAQCKTYYLVTVVYNHEQYTIREGEDGLIYCDQRASGAFPIKIAATDADINANVRSAVMWPGFQRVVAIFRAGQMRFADIKTKQAMFMLMGVSMKNYL